MSNEERVIEVLQMRGTPKGVSDGVLERLAVIESKLEALLIEVTAIREMVPAKMVEHAERITVLERNMRTMQWSAGVFAASMIGAFIAHVLGG
ncbi:MAG: hypothetical protein HYX78_09865 [Armatimonadetes bacterium]|nr:hypothetical protein [Armatimonadota bacterium]